MTFPSPDVVPTEENDEDIFSTFINSHMSKGWSSAVVDEQTAGHFLHILRAGTPNRTYLPQGMETEAGCDQVASHFHLAPLLQTVHERKAYAWLATESKHQRRLYFMVDQHFSSSGSHLAGLSFSRHLQCARCRSSTRNYCQNQSKGLKTFRAISVQARPTAREC